MIYEIRGKQIILYNETIKSKLEKFTERFSWNLTSYE